MTKFDEIIKEYHELNNTTNKCYILNCGRPTEIAVKGLQSDNIHFYCNRCAFELITTFSNLYEKVNEPR